MQTSRNVTSWRAKKDNWKTQFCSESCPCDEQKRNFLACSIEIFQQKIILKLVEINGYLKSFSERLIQKTCHQRVSDAQSIYLLQKRLVSTPKMRKVQTNFIFPFMGRWKSSLFNPLSHNSTTVQQPSQTCYFLFCILP